MLTSPPVFPSPFNKTEKGCKLVNGTRLYYERKGTGQPLVFIHSFALDHRMWDDQFQFFSKWYCCIRYDLRGYGQSALPGNDAYTFHDDLKCLLFSLEISEPVILVGLSLGAGIAANFALKYPRFTKAIVLTDPEIDGYNFKELKLDTIFNSARNKGIDYAKRKWSEHPLFIPAKRNKTVAASLEQMIHYYSGWHFVDTTPLTESNPAAWQLLPDIGLPALILYGELDLPDYQEMSESVAGKIPGSKKRKFSDTGHFSNMETPGEFNKELKDFLDPLVA